jgi:hypothetical protein
MITNFVARPRKVLVSRHGDEWDQQRERLAWTSNTSFVAAVVYIKYATTQTHSAVGSSASTYASFLARGPIHTTY